MKKNLSLLLILATFALGACVGPRETASTTNASLAPRVVASTRTKNGSISDAILRFLRLFNAVTPTSSTVPRTTSTVPPTTSTIAERSKCTDGSVCKVGDIGPGGGTVFYASPTAFTSGAPCGTSCRYLEALPAGCYDICDNNSAYGTYLDLPANSPLRDPYTYWGCVRTTWSPLIVARQVGAGFANSNEIRDRCSGMTWQNGERWARSLTFGGKSDWYVPSHDELALLYANRAVAGRFADYWYMSSSDSQSDAGACIDFSTREPGADIRCAAGMGMYYVRPIRAF